MKRFVKIFFVYLLMFPFVYFAYTKDNSSIHNFFNEGNKYYQNGQYDQALQCFQRILDSGYQNGSLYFNMGNCHYKMNNVGKAILFYERALRHMPGDADIQANLELANKTVVDEITPMDQFFMIRFLNAYYYYLPFNIQLWFTGGLYLICGLLFTFWILIRKHNLKRITFRFAIIFCVLLLVFGLSLVGRVLDQSNRVEAIILMDEIAVLSAPGTQDGSVEVFALHEGTKVKIDREEGEWLEIVLLDGKVGWVQRSVLEII